MKSSHVSVTALILSIILLVINLRQTETITVTSCAICIVLFGISSYWSIVREEHLRVWITVVTLISLVIGTLSPFLGLKGTVAAFLETLPNIFVAMLIIAEMIAFMGMRQDRMLFATFSVFFSMAIASFAAIVTYVIRIEEIRSEIIVNNDIIVQFGASFITSVVVIILVNRIMKKQNVRLITKEALLEGSL